jgi:hypothetical protein
MCASPENCISVLPRISVELEISATPGRSRYPSPDEFGIPEFDISLPRRELPSLSTLSQDNFLT